MEVSTTVTSNNVTHVTAPNWSQDPENHNLNTHLCETQKTFVQIAQVWDVDAVRSGGRVLFQWNVLRHGRIHRYAPLQMMVPVNQTTRRHIPEDRKLQISTPYLIKTTFFSPQVCEEQKCQEEVFPLAMNYVDRFLSVCPIRKNQLQLLGTACLLLSSKLRQPHGLATEDLVFYTDNSISIDDLAVSRSALPFCVSLGVDKRLEFVIKTHTHTHTHTHTQGRTRL